MYDLGLSPAEAWRLTPRDLDLLRERHTERMEREEFFVGLLASSVLNPHRGKRRAFSPFDFFPHLKKTERLSDRQLFKRIATSLKAKKETQ